MKKTIVRKSVRNYYLVIIIISFQWCLSLYALFCSEYKAFEACARKWSTVSGLHSREKQQFLSVGVSRISTNWEDSLVIEGPVMEFLSKDAYSNLSSMGKKAGLPLPQYPSRNIFEYTP